MFLLVFPFGNGDVERLTIVVRDRAKLYHPVSAVSPTNLTEPNQCVTTSYQLEDVTG